MRRVVDLTGQEFGLLTVQERHPKETHGRVTWICNCRCGRQKRVLGVDLMSGDKQSCGCVARGIRKRRNTGRADELVEAAEDMAALIKSWSRRHTNALAKMGVVFDAV